jgi:ATP-dependent helicase/nuclease subunit A
MKTIVPSLTPQQQAALEARDRSVSLAAGAGCGKTFVLTERFIAELDPTQVQIAALDELVAITFTDAAAREMRDRIRRRCFERMQTAADRQEAAAWQRLMRSIDAARISTIHSFCADLLRTYSVEAGLDPQFAVLDAAAAALVKLEAVDDRLRTLLLAGDEDVLNLAARRGLEQLRNEVAALAGPRFAAVIAAWRHATPQDLLERWQRCFAEKAAPLAYEELLQCEAAHALRRLADPIRAATERLRKHLPQVAGALQLGKGADDQLEVSHLRSLTMVRGVCTAKDWHDGSDYEQFRDACKCLREKIDRSILAKPIDLEASRDAAEQGLALLRLADDASAALEGAKGQRNQLEFDDLLARTHQLLTDPQHADIRSEVASRVRLVMVDEFQDTNPLQMAIVEAVCGEDWRERGLFAVGDFKQSIYRFNGAEPEVSTRLRETLPPAGRLSLTRNFRSQPAITDFVNALFWDAFDGYEPLIPSRDQETPTPAVEFIWTLGEAGDDSDGNGEDEPPPPRSPMRKAGAARESRLREARRIAARLAELLASPEKIVVDQTTGEPRPLQPGDVAILLRTLSDAQVYEEALRERGLEYYLAGGHAFYSQQEVFDVLNLLRAVASRVDEIALAGALRSPFFSLADETLFWLVETHGSLNAGLQAEKPPKDLSVGEAAKVRRAAAALQQLRDAKDVLLVADLLAFAIELTGYDAVLLTEFLGQRKAANLEKLLEQARSLDQTSPGDLQGYLTQLSEFVARAPKEALAATQAEGDVIRIMTFHYAKGLEFPLVVLPDLDRPRHSGWSPAVLVPELGPLVSPRDEERKTSLGMAIFRLVENAKELEERKRLLYVACTRAADYLILSSSLKDVSEPKQDWLRLVDSRISLADGTLRAPLPEGYGTPHIRVTVETEDAPAGDGGEPRGRDLVRLVAKTRELASANPRELPASAEPIPVDAAARRRFSFSGLTGHLTIEPELPADPQELDEVSTLVLPTSPDDGDGDAVDGRLLGSLVHQALERVDFRRLADAGQACARVAAQIAELVPDEVVAQATAIVERFLATPRAAELARAAVIRREVEFLLPWPPGGDGFTGRYVHGYIDCLYQDDRGHWHVLDFKSNRIEANQVQQTAARYEMQMLVYRLACEQALGTPLAESTLAFLQPGVEHSSEWDVPARQRGIERITAAMQSLIESERQ